MIKIAYVNKSKRTVYKIHGNNITDVNGNKVDVLPMYLPINTELKETTEQAVIKYTQSTTNAMYLENYKTGILLIK